MDGGRAIAGSALSERQAISVRHGAGERRRRGLRPAGGAWLGLVVPALLLLLWQASAAFGLLPEQLLPAPWAVWEVIRDGVADGSLASATLVSLRRVSEGFGAGAIAGLILGAAMGLAPPLRRALEPSVLAVGQVPVFGWVPILVLLFGLDDTPKIIVIAWSAFIPVMLNTVQGVADVPPAYLELGRVLGFGRWSMFRSVVLPAALPPVFTGLREGLANAWQSLVAVELIASFEGLGYMMAYGRQLFQLEMVFAAALVIGAIGLALHLALSRIERSVQGWRLEPAR